jgi:hypothetical protein
VKQLLTLSLVIIALLTIAGCAATPSLEQSACTRLARPGDTKLQMYCASPHGDVLVDAGWRSKSCRRVVKPGDGMVVLPFCGNSREWDVFDSWAVGADMTCRWAGTRHELCMTATKWNGMDAAKWNDLKRGTPPVLVNWSETGSNWPVNNTTWVPFGSGAGSGCCPLR